MYCDNSATTKLTDNVKKYIIEVLDCYGNPSSSHSLGYQSNLIINNARKNVAKFINTQDENIIFTPSGSAANALAILGLINKILSCKLYYSPMSHKSMLLACEHINNSKSLVVNKNGDIDLIELEFELCKLNKITPIVCIDAANSEIGTVRDVKRICRLVHAYEGIVIADFTGYIPSIKVDVCDLDVDIATFSGHKLHALKGIGVLYKKEDIQLSPIVFGSQEFGLWGGTENILGIASLGKAVEEYDYSLIYAKNRNDLYFRLIQDIPNCYLVGDLENRLPNNLYMCFKGINGNDLLSLLDLDDIQVSTGSACNSGDLNPSKTLLAIKMNQSDINSCIRISLSGNETKEEIDFLFRKIRDNVKFLRGNKG